MRLNGSIDHEFIDLRLAALDEYFKAFCKYATEPKNIPEDYADLSEWLKDASAKSEHSGFSLPAAQALIHNSCQAIFKEHQHLVNNDLDSAVSMMREHFLAPLGRMLPDFLPLGFVISVEKKPPDSLWKIYLQIIDRGEIYFLKSTNVDKADSRVTFFENEYIVVVRMDKPK